MIAQRTWKMLGPIALSAVSLFLSFIIIQPIATWLDPTFSLLANRGVGKIAFTTLVILQIVLLLFTQSKQFGSQWLKTNIAFFKENQRKWIYPFLSFFIIFFFMHIFILAFYFLSGQISYNPNWGFLSVKLILRILFGFIATFFLAWTEELIFRGTLYPYFAQYVRPISSIFITSLIFMLAHDLSNPLNLVTTHWKLGLGLFLLGVLLNIIFALTHKLYICMGAHAGLVFVKVILRRIPILAYLPASQYMWAFTKDLRESHTIHILFAITIIILIVRYKNILLGYKKR